VNKSAILTEEEYETYCIYSEVLRYIHEYQSSNNLQPRDIRILDWGCARGKMVLRLRELGYEAYGVDVQQKYLDNSAQLFADKGYDHHDILRVVGTDGSNDFPDSTFDIIVSIQVLEHVELLDNVACKMSRLLKPGGISFHWLPPRWCFMEPHYYIPFVHWFPKNIIRKCIIMPYVMLGFFARNWKEEYSGQGVFSITHAIYNYSLKQTFYRPRSHLTEIFDKAGLNVRFVTMDNPRLKKLGCIYRLLTFSIMSRLTDFGLCNFVHNEFVAKKPVRLQ